MNRLGMVVVVPLAAAFTVVLALVLLTILEVTGPIFAALSGVEGPAGVTPDAIGFNTAWLIFATVGMLSIPVSVALALFFGSNEQEPQVERRGPF